MTSYYNRLNNIFDNLLINQNTILIIINASVKNNIVTSVSHIYRRQKVIYKSIHHAINITVIKAELFAIKYRINYVVQLQDVACIIIVTDIILAAKRIFNSSIHSYQLYSIVIFKSLKCFFKKNLNNVIAFWNCSNNIKWSLYLLVNKESKHIKIDLIFPSKMS